jgi:[ribosomal protein S5]-alanine N-acetyltransferase
MKKPFLTGGRIYLRGLQEKDLEGNYVQWLNDEEVCQYNSHHVFPYSYESAKNYIKNVRQLPDALVLAIVLKETDFHIGNVSLQRIDYVSRNAEFAILLGEREYWGKGLSNEAARLIIGHGFSELNLHRISCGTSSKNTPMQKLAISLGMSEEGRRRAAMYKHGQFVDIIEYGILCHEFINKTEV